jgi:hypothetical protein
MFAKFSNITRVNGSIAIDTGIVQASITRTVFDQNPVAVFAVSKVLLPKEMFGRGDSGNTAMAPPSVAMAPRDAGSEKTPQTRLSSPPDLHSEDSESSASLLTAKGTWWCIGLMYLQLHLLLSLV